MGTSSLLAVEKPHLPRPTFREILRDLGPYEIGDGLVALLFSASGPIAVILAAAAARLQVPGHVLPHAGGGDAVAHQVAGGEVLRPSAQVPV